MHEVGEGKQGDNIAEKYTSLWYCVCPLILSAIGGTIL